MIHETFSVTIGRDREHVFRILTDFEHYLARWAKGPVAVQKLTSGDEPGTRFTITARVGPFKVKSPYEVTVSEQPARFGGSGVAGPVSFMEEYSLTLTPAGDTNLTQQLTARPRGPFRLAEKAVAWQLRRLISADLERLRVLAEAES